MSSDQTRQEKPSKSTHAPANELITCRKPNRNLADTLLRMPLTAPAVFQGFCTLAATIQAPKNPDQSSFTLLQSLKGGRRSNLMMDERSVTTSLVRT
jgi:hypothetical protein